AHPDDRNLAATCAAALSAMPIVPPLGQEQARALDTAFPDQFAATELLVRLNRTDPEELKRLLDSLIHRLDDGTIPPEAPDLTLSLVRVARMARLAKLPEAARTLLR